MNITEVKVLTLILDKHTRTTNVKSTRGTTKRIAKATNTEK